MSQRDSGYKRVAFDQYETPEWVTQALIPHIPKYDILEPAAGNGKMAKVIIANGFVVEQSDIQTGVNFLTDIHKDYEAIVTNPPYAAAFDFIDTALNLTYQKFGFVAMLLRTDFDHAKSRRGIFADHYAFAKKIVLTKRIQWFEDSKSSPSFNHAWFIWDWNNTHSPTLCYHFED